MKVAVLSAGEVAADVARRLLADSSVDEMVIADLDGARAEGLAAELGCRGMQCDVRDAESVAAVVSNSDVVFNGVGPYFRFGTTVIEESLEAGAHYVDICDEYDTTERLMENEQLDRMAKEKGLTVLTCMGAAPGVTNLVARWAADQLDQAETIQIVMGLPLIVNLGVTINEHMLHSLSGTVRQFQDGRFVDVDAWGDPRAFALLPPLDRGEYVFSYWGHAESITLPRFIPGLREVSSRFTWLQEGGNRLYQNLAALGLASQQADGLPMSPRQYTAQLMASDVGSSAMAVALGDHPMMHFWHIEVSGMKDGTESTVIVEAHGDLSGPPSSEPGGHTGLPASMAVRQVMDGTITRRGVVAPEGCIDPEPFWREACLRTGLEVHCTIQERTRLV